jgi:hypothetical protein
MSIKIFLSTVSDEFRDYRDQLRSDLTRHNVEVKVQENFKDSGSVTLDKLDLYINTCDAVVHLVGDMTGADAKPASTATIIAKYPDIAEKLPPLREPLEQGLGISYTQWEAWLALYHGKALLIAKADDDAPRGPNYNPTDISRAAQQMHLQRLSDIERYPGFTFSSPDNLAKQIAYTTILDLLAKDKQAEPPRDPRSFPYAAIVAVLFLLLLTPLAADHLTKAIGLTLAAPISLLGAAGGLALALLYWRYFGILDAGAEPSGSLERQAYDALRASLATGGLPARLYSRWLTAFLDAVDRFFGDAGMADRTLFPRAFGLRTPAPLWTAPAFDRSLLLALIYPIVTIFIMWAISGHAGPAEKALYLQQNFSDWLRGGLVAITASLLLAVFWGARAARWNSPLSVAAAAGAVFPGTLFLFLAAHVAFTTIGTEHDTVDILGGLFAILFALVISIVVVGAGAVAVTGVIAVVVACSIAFTSLPDTGLLGRISFVVGTIFAIVFVVVLVVASLNVIATRHQWRGVFLLLFLITMILGCLGAVRWLPPGPIVGPLLLFLGLLTLLNAPFDWASLGLTRALLRRGLELGGWWPYLLALVDALLAGVIIALLALTMVIGVQAFDGLAVHDGGKPVLPLPSLFNGLAAHPEAPEYWWIYALLLSTTIPSLVNLVIGGTALTRTAPGLPSLLLQKMPAGRAVPAFDRAWIALVLTLQVAGGVFLGVAAQALLAVGLIRYVMPWAGLGLLDMARAVAAFDLPARVGALF